MQFVYFAYFVAKVISLGTELLLGKLSFGLPNAKNRLGVIAFDLEMNVANVFRFLLFKRTQVITVSFAGKLLKALIIVVSSSAICLPPCIA